MACKHCGSDCKAVSDVPEMPFEDFAPVLDEIKLHQPGIKTLVFTVGGEPLVRKDIVECADCQVFKYCQGNGMHLRNDDGSLMFCNYNKLLKNK